MQIVLYILGFILLYIVIRLAVKHGIVDAMIVLEDKKSDSHDEEEKSKE
ncbi:MAG: hypothetical protein HFE63_09490 [Clostridiales bacterium]|nr:hypothetical protein [Clostridiales bacterium]